MYLHCIYTNHTNPSTTFLRYFHAYPYPSFRPHPAHLSLTARFSGVQDAPGLINRFSGLRCIPKPFKPFTINHQLPHYQLLSSGYPEACRWLPAAYRWLTRGCRRLTGGLVVAWRWLVGSLAVATLWGVGLDWVSVRFLDIEGRLSSPPPSAKDECALLTRRLP